MDDREHPLGGSVYQRRQIWDSKDTVPRELQFLQPLNASHDQVTRIMVGPRRYINSQDGSAQSLAASTSLLVNFSANTMNPGTWSNVSLGAGILVECLRAFIQASDASGKLQIVIPLNIGLCVPINLGIAATNAPLPYTFPAITGVNYQIVALQPMQPILPSDQLYANGPSASMGLVNTDTVGPHTYIRNIAFTYRPIYDMDYTKERVYVMGTLT